MYAILTRAGTKNVMKELKKIATGAAKYKDGLVNCQINVSLYPYSTIII